MLVMRSQLPSFHRDLDPHRRRASHHRCGPGASSIGIIDLLYYNNDTLSPSCRQSSVDYFHRTCCWYRRVCTVHSIDNFGRCRLLAMFLPWFGHWIGCLHGSQRGHNDHGEMAGPVGAVLQVSLQIGAIIAFFIQAGLLTVHSGGIYNWTNARTSFYFMRGGSVVWLILFLAWYREPGTRFMRLTGEQRW